MDLEAIRKAAIRVCGELGCAYIILFGSRASRAAKAYSDVDVAVKFKVLEDIVEVVARAASIFEEMLGVEVDVIPLNLADTILRYEVFAGGITLMVKDYSEYMDDLVNAIDEYLDFEKSFEEFYRNLVGMIRDAASRC